MIENNKIIYFKRLVYKVLSNGKSNVKMSVRVNY